MLQHEFFEKKLHAPLCNIQWSWGAKDRITNRVFLRVWEDEMRKDSRGEWVQVFWTDWNSRSLGKPERLKHISAIQNGAQGIAILCKAKNTSRDLEKRQIKSYDENTLLLLGEIIERGKAVFARIVDRFPIEDLHNGVITNQRTLLPQKVTRICYNSYGWQRPSGEAEKLEASGNYAHKNKFGHEEWLFRSEWQIDGWRYAFMQGVGRSRERLAHDKQPFDLTLFTIEPGKRYRFVAKINAVECLDGKQAQASVRVFKEKGWFETMRNEIAAIRGNVAALDNARHAHDILNIRFRLEDVRM